MKRSEMIKIMAGLLSTHEEWEKDHPSVFIGVAAEILTLIEEAGMLPPERPDEHPLGYGGAWLDVEEVERNYKLFKHSWEPEDE